MPYNELVLLEAPVRPPRMTDRVSRLSPPTNSPICRVLYLGEGNWMLPNGATRPVPAADPEREPSPDPELDPSPIPDPSPDPVPNPDPPKALEVAPPIAWPIVPERPKLVLDDCPHASHGIPATTTNAIPTDKSGLRMA